MSDYRQSANKRRDTRHTKLEIRAPSGSKKDTKRWCKGHVGREHKLICVTDSFFKDRHILRCETCGKKLDFWWPHPWNKKPKPDWVTF